MLADRERHLARPVAIARAGSAPAARRYAAPAPNPYVAFASRWWWLISIFALLGLAGGLAFQRYGPMPYTSTSLIAVTSATDPTTTTLSAPSKDKPVAESLAAQLRSGPIAEAVSQALAGKVAVTPADLAVAIDQKKIDIRAVKGSNLISITTTDTDPFKAFQIADTYAAVFVDKINTTANDMVVARKRDLESQIDFSRQQLQTTQLKAREQEILKSIESNRAMLLQLQLQYQQELQRQIDTDRAQAQSEALARGPAAAADATRLTPEGQERVQQLAAQQARARQAAISVAAAQVTDVQATIDSLSRQLAAVQSAIAQGNSQPAPEPDASQPPPPDVNALLQQRNADLQRVQRELEFAKQVKDQRTLLQNTERDLQNQLQAQRNRQTQLQMQAQQVTQQAIDAEAKVASADTKRAREALRDAADAAAANRDRTLSTIQGQQRDTETAIAALNNQLTALNQKLSQLPAELDPSAILAKQQQVADLQQQIADLKQQVGTVDQQNKQSQSQVGDLRKREQDLIKQLADERAHLRQVQLAYQTEVQKQTEAERKQVETDQRQPAGAAPTAPADPSPAAAARQADIARTTAMANQVRNEWLKVISDQQLSVQQRIGELNQDLNQVREAISKQPPTTDAAGLTTFSAAYGDLLAKLTRDYVRLQLNEDNVNSPLERYGDASDPVVISSLRRTLPLGAGAGLGIGCALAYLLELRRQRRDALAAPVAETALARVADPGPAPVSYAGARAGARRPLPAARIRRRRTAEA